MDFDLSEEQKMLKKNVRDFLENEIAPIAGKRDRQGPLTKEETIGFIKKLMPFGYYVGSLPQEYGGPGLDRLTMAILSEELSRVWAGLAATIGIAATATVVIVLFSPTEALRDKLLPQILLGREVTGIRAFT